MDILRTPPARRQRLRRTRTLHRAVFEHSNLSWSLLWPRDLTLGKPPCSFKRANAAFVALVRNSEREAIRDSMRSVESRFNKKFGYPWVFLNDEPFDEAFKVGVRKMTRSEVTFGTRLPSYTVTPVLDHSADTVVSQHKFRKSTGVTRVGSTRPTQPKSGRKW